MGVSLPVLWDILEEHLDEGETHWEQWERALRSPRFLPRLMWRLEEQLQANIDGVAIDSAIQRLLRRALLAKEPARVSFAASVLLALPNGLTRVLGALRAAQGVRRGALTRALALSPRSDLDQELLFALQEGNPSLTAGALEALAFRRIDAGPLLLEYLDSSTEVVRAAALRAARVSAQPARGWIARGCEADSASVREAAIESGLLLGYREAYHACHRRLDAGDASPLVLAALAISGDPNDSARIETVLERPELCSAALVALGYTGRVNAMERILEYSTDPKLGRVAGEAFSAITGVVIEGALEAEVDDEPPPLEEDDLDVSPDPGPAGDLPLPDPEMLQHWWSSEERRFDPSVRYVAGHPFSLEKLHGAFLRAPMRRRHLLGLELAVRTRRQYWVETSTWASEQLHQQQNQELRIRGEMEGPFAKLLEV